MRVLYALCVYNIDDSNIEYVATGSVDGSEFYVRR